VRPEGLCQWKIYIRLYEYERGRRSQCFSTQIMHGSGRLLPFVFYVIGLSDRAGFLSW